MTKKIFVVSYRNGYVVSFRNFETAKQAGRFVYSIRKHPNISDIELTEEWLEY